MSISLKLIILTVVIVVGNGLIGYAFYKSTEKLNDSQNWIEHSEQVIYQSASILSLAKDFESSSRGYVLTNDNFFIEQLISAKNVIFTQIGILRQLVKDNSSQINRVDTLHNIINLRLQYSLKTIDIMNNQGLDSSIKFISNQQGLHYSNQMREITNSIREEENVLLKNRKQTNQKSADAFNTFAIIMFIAMNGFTVLLIIVVGKNFYQIKDKKIKTAELIAAKRERDFEILQKENQELANKELEAFSYSISHDLRAPLRHIGGFVGLLIKNNSTQLDEQGLRYLNIISESSHEMGCLIDAILSFSKLNRGDLNKTLINSENMVKKVLSTFSDELEGRDVEINISELPDMKGDEHLINQVWVNLISNAIKYSRKKEKAVINIGGKIENNEIIFHIKDNGAGFDMNYATKLFGVFQRLHKAKDFEGVGIGLANVNRIVVRHGGKCRAEGEVNNGAVFFFSVPVI